MLLTYKTRKRIPENEFGLQSERKYPMPDREHAANAKARATQMVKKGKLSMAKKEMIDAKANKVLGKKVKKETITKVQKKVLDARGHKMAKKDGGKLTKAHREILNDESHKMIANKRKSKDLEMPNLNDKPNKKSMVKKDKLSHAKDKMVDIQSNKVLMRNRKY